MVDQIIFVADGANDAANIMSSKGQPYDSTSTYYILASSFQWAKVGHRFQGVNIDQGATITLAEFTAFYRVASDISPSWSANISIKGVDQDDLVVWASSSNEPKDKTLTTEEATQNFTNADAGATPFTKTTDVTSIIQEIVDRGSWASGNDLGIIQTGNQTLGIARAILAHVYELYAGRNLPAKLEITLSSGERRIFIVKGT